jgi:hypothetical protein
MSKTNVNITKNNNEPGAGMLKRFSGKMKEYGIIPRVKSIKYSERKPSKLKMKKIKLVKLEGEKIYNFKKKMGKIVYKKRFNSKPPATETKPTMTKSIPATVNAK